MIIPLKIKSALRLIATGFEHKDPFDKKASSPVAEVKKKDEKIVMVSAAGRKEKTSQPLFLFDEKNETADEKNVEAEEENIIEQKGFKTLKDEDVYAALQKEALPENIMAPKIVEITGA